ncbi:TPA: autotransporter outer membrane beta-barrel domain-containing protein [Campylobacter coli]|uniref:autotransporter outer membrane beta-barrel domain-containing protein n=1 Tax=Campylobacter coli TaxID=195 RepID=UPI0012E66A0C|nr:autotransporter outer membrane beta-barrel domain-containing protein [Campylobacter coli]ECR3119612.1 autotransporter outer membrane beta-barrel domain-containing protein [Campylobacter coli]MDN2740068.1 autotransporter outer membrane beta-barrel domain-containing protein [Campylobacter coli]HEF9067014.1 autotransporter outer membrane beta-barrel domain-containing protein [Campylobacter coli]HEF9169811.1 autotransporter outer membrane beta-barrel domain-containing protein [Campylobacter coli
MKKNASSKILLSLGVATLLYSSAFAQEINLAGSSDIGKYFEENGKDINLKNPDKYKGQDLNIKMGVWDLPNDDYDSADYRLNIDIGKNNTLSFTHNNGQNPVYVTNLNATAKEVKTTDIVLQASAPSVINGNLTMTSSGAGTITEDEKKGSGIILYNGNGAVEGKSANGSLTINGNFTADKTLFAAYGNFVKVNGTANLTNSNFGLMKRSYTDLEANNVVIVQAKDFNENILKANNNAGALLLKFAGDYISTDVQGKDPLEAITIIDISDEDKYGDGEKGLVDYKLSVQNCGGNKCLVINGGATAAAKDKLVQLQVDIDTIDKLLKNEFDSSQGEEWEQAKETLKKQQAELQTMLEEAKKNGGKIDDEKYIDLVNKNSNLNLSANDKASILALRSITEQLGSIGADLASREGVKLALDIKKDTDNTGKSVSNLNSASSAVNTTMNISNDVSIGSRVAMLNNPFGTYASKMNGLKFAALDSDMRPSYVNEYTNSVWANAFGGANIIDGDSGAMYGATVGVDKQANDDVLWGAYFTYANAKIKDNNLEQKSDNFQLGMYSTINVAPQWELNLKAYAQVSPTKQDNVQIDGAYNSDYTSKFLGLSANAGRVFDFSDNTLFIKPFAGVNYYFSYTPSHTENGAIAKDIDSMKNNSVSVEVGAEFRKYMNENSYIFVTPKIEQFVINSGDDYTANLAVNNAFFTSVEANNKKKTYGQIIVGGNVDFTNQLSMNLGFGAKQILAGKVDNKNETYLSGQVGLKYKF